NATVAVHHLLAGVLQSNGFEMKSSERALCSEGSGKRAYVRVVVGGRHNVLQRRTQLRPARKTGAVIHLAEVQRATHRHIEFDLRRHRRSDVGEHEPKPDSVPERARNWTDLLHVVA